MPRDGEWRKITVSTSSSHAVKKWMSVSAFEKVEDSECPRGKEFVQDYVKSRRSSVPPSTTPNAKSRLAMVYAEPTKLSIADLQTLDCWANPKERSDIHALENRLVTFLICDYWQKRGIQDLVVLGNRVFGPPRTLTCGVERRGGYKLKLLFASGSDPSIHRTPCNQLFFKPIQVSDFMVEQAGATSNGSHDAHITRLNKLLKGVLVDCFFSKKAKSQAIQQVVNLNANEIDIPSPGAVPSSITLAELFSRVHGHPLRFPKLPCIDFGTGGRHFYVPAEACLINPNQPFGHPLPLVVDDAAFVPRQANIKRSTKSPMQVNPFGELGTKDFSFCFAQVVILPEGAHKEDLDEFKHLSTARWERFQDAIGSRFRNKLDNLVRDADHVVLPYRQGVDSSREWAELLSRLAGERRGVKKVLIACIPAGQFNNAIHKALHRLCDTELGIQCNIVTAREVGKRAAPGNGPTYDTLTKYTGAVVRKVFARASLPGKTSEDDKKEALFQEHYGAALTNSSLAGTSTPSKLLVGIHVQLLTEVLAASSADMKSVNHLLITVSTISDQHAVAETVRTTQHVVSLDVKSLQEKVHRCVQLHLSRADGMSNSVQQLAFFRSGFGAQDRMHMRSEMEKLASLAVRSPSSDQSTSNVTDFYTFLEPPTLHLSENSKTIVLDDINCVAKLKGLAGPVPGRSHSELFHFEPEQVRSEQRTVGVADAHMADLSKFNSTLKKVFVRAHTDLQRSHKTYLITHAQTVQEVEKDGRDCTDFEKLVQAKGLSRPSVLLTGKVEAFRNAILRDTPLATSDLQLYFFHSYLQKAVLPDIMFLTQKAANRALKYVELGQGQDVDGEETPYTMPEIHEALQHSLYFL
ncbi:uncharacterized protein LTR77_005245 [Saxophila tyrrhenica]|uniref:Piwi domain-containing protein n=1 Tax=Saxophila tyrrhenica TaxID=1690608 RepID=A0AAV9PCA5_9PEZI|nr:hypothetical protein LTR77_005245 [Saxophila tyrrhenica]